MLVLLRKYKFITILIFYVIIIILNSQVKMELLFILRKNEQITIFCA